MASECAHDVVLSDMCAICGHDLKPRGTAAFMAKAVTSSRPKAVGEGGRVAVVASMPELRVNSGLAVELDLDERRRLLQSRKLALLVDLDQTVLHTTNLPVPPRLDALCDEQDRQNRARQGEGAIGPEADVVPRSLIHVQLEQHPGHWHHTKFRPHAIPMLRRLAKKFELHVCTFGSRSYAHTLVRHMDVDGALFSHRILSRDESFDWSLKAANLRSLFPCGDDLVSIIDDRADVWQHAPNLVLVRPYQFFSDYGDINAPTGGHAHYKPTRNGHRSHYTDSDFDWFRKLLNEPRRASEVGKKRLPMSLQKGDLLRGKPPLVTRVCSTSAPNSPSTKTVRMEEDIDDSEAVAKNPIRREDDDYLLALENILLRIHTEFFKRYGEHENGKVVASSVRDVTTYVRSQTLKGCRLTFSGVAPLNTDVENCPVVRLARLLGADVVMDFDFSTIREPVGGDAAFDQHIPTHLVAARPGTSKVRAFVKARRRWRLYWRQRQLRRSTSAATRRLSLGDDIDSMQIDDESINECEGGGYEGPLRDDDYDGSIPMLVSVQWLYACSETWTKAPEYRYPLVHVGEVKQHWTFAQLSPPDPMSEMRRRAAERLTACKDNNNDLNGENGAGEATVGDVVSKMVEDQVEEDEEEIDMDKLAAQSHFTLSKLSESELDSDSSSDAPEVKRFLLQRRAGSPNAMKRRRKDGRDESTNDNEDSSSESGDSISRKCSLLDKKRRRIMHQLSSSSNGDDDDEDDLCGADY